MKLSTKARYGVRAMLSLALDYGKGPVPLKEIAKHQGISEKYLEHLMVPLKSAGLVRSIRGMHGGYTLARPPLQINLNEVVQALEGSIAPVDCLDDPSICHHSELCITRRVWEKMQHAMGEVLKSTTLKDLVEQQNEQKQSEGMMYNI